MIFKISMKLYFLLSIIIILALDSVHASKKEEKNNDEKSGDQFYLILVKNESKVNNTNTHEKREEKEAFLDSLVSEIDNLIIGNIDTFEDPSVLEEIEKDSSPSPLRRRSEGENDETKYTHVISTVKDESIVFTYLSKDLVPLVEDLPNVVVVIPDIEMENYSATPNPGYLKNITDTYDWKNSCVRANSYLSIISQDKYENSNLSNKYDSNYYYPGSAGEGINIFVVDDGFDFRHPDFASNNGRTVKCIASITQTNTNNESVKYDDVCNEGNSYHGSAVANVAGGLTKGVASNANIYGVVINTSRVLLSSILKSLQFIDHNYLNLENTDNVNNFLHKTVINISSGISYRAYMSIATTDENRSVPEYLYNLITEMSNKGAVFVVAAGNDSISVDHDLMPCGFDNVICVGSTDNIRVNYHPLAFEFMELKKNEYNRELYSLGEWYDRMDENASKFSKLLADVWTSGTRYISSDSYRTAFYSNYGQSVDIYAPGFVEYNYHDEEGNHSTYNFGTSFSSPVVAGIAATIMSEKPYKNFTTQRMKEYLYEIGIKDSIEGIAAGNPNVFVNNGKLMQFPVSEYYNKCGTTDNAPICKKDKELECFRNGCCLRN